MLGRGQSTRTKATSLSGRAAEGAAGGRRQNKGSSSSQ
jgi:hypothetical protein